MQLRPYASMAVVVVALCLTRCSNEPNVIISIPEQKATVCGTISPKGAETIVNLTSGGATIVSTEADPQTGQFSFVGVDYGLYTLIATNSNSGVRTSFLVENRFLNLSRLFLTAGHGALRWAQFESGDTICSSHIRNDSMFSIEVTLNNWTILDPQPISITPTRLASSAILATSGTYYHTLTLPVDSLFSGTEISLTLRFQDTDLQGTVSADSIVFRYAIDSTGLDSILTDRLVSRVYAADSSIITDWYGKHHLTLPNRENRVAVVFTNAMNTESVERSISIAPPCAMSFFWSADTLILAPANSLMKDTTYTIIIGTGAMTADSTHFRCSYPISVDANEQTFFHNYWPLTGAVEVDRALPFVFESRYSIEPDLLRRAFSIAPAADSLVFESAGPGAVQVRHAALLPDTSYQITIDGSLTSRLGTELGADLVVTFTTVGR